MDNGIISYSKNFRTGISHSLADSQEDENDAHNFITKVMESLLRVDGASYAFCHYNGTCPPAREWEPVRSKLAYLSLCI